MSVRTCVVNLNPSDGVPAVRLNQYDTGVTLLFTVMDGESPADFDSGTTVTIQGTRPSGTGYSLAATLDGNFVTVDSTIEMTREYGDSVCELRFAKNGVDVGTGNFRIGVEKAAFANDAIDENVNHWNQLAQQVHADTITATDAALAAGNAVSGAQSAATSAADSADRAFTYAKVAQDAKDDIHEYISDAEAWATGTRNGEDVPSTDEAYENNAKYYTEKAAEHVTTAGERADAAEGSAQDSEAYAIGTRGGVAVGSEDPAYHNNAKYWAENGGGANIASLFDANKAYTAGDYVLYNNYMYRFTVDHAAGAWDASHVTAVKVGDELTDLKGDLKQFLRTVSVEINGSTGNRYIQYKVSTNNTYTISNGTNEMCSIKTCNTTSGDTVQNVSDGLDSGISIEFTATDDANYLRLYFSQTATGDIEILEKPPIVEKILGDVIVTKNKINKAFIGIVKTITGSGTKYEEFPITNGNTYTISNNTNQICSIRTGNTTSGDTVQNVSDGLRAGETIRFTAIDDANYLRFYFSSSAEGNIDITSNADYVKSIQNELNELNTDVAQTEDSLKMIFSGSKKTITGSGTKYEEFPITNGNTYTISNNTNQICSIRTGNTTSGDTVQNVSDGLRAGETIRFTAIDDANYLRFYFSSSAEGCIFIEDTSSRVVKIEESMLRKDTNAVEYPINRDVNTASSGITYSWNNDACTITGTASALSRIYLFSDMNQLPAGMIAGNQYQLLFDGEKSEIRIYPSFDGTSIDTSNPVVITNKNSKFSLPSNCTGIQIWLSVKSGVTINEIVHPYLTNTWSNQELTKQAEVLYRSNYFKTGKTLVTLGDSIFGNNTEQGTGVPDLIAKHSDLNVINAAFGGTRMVKRSSDISVSRCSFDFENLLDAIISGDFSAQEQTIVDHPSDVLQYYTDRLNSLRNINWGDVDYITINYGTNDWEAGTSTDEYVTAYETTLIRFMTEFPHIRVFVVTPTFRFWINSQLEVVDDSNTKAFGNPSKNLPTFIESLKSVEDNLNISLIDCYHIGINRYNWTHYFSQYDTTHQSINGRELIAMHVAGQLMSN